MRVAVDAKGAGYHVIADAIQHGWVATIDGSKTPLRAVNHALGGVRVPAGHHMLVVRAKPSGWYYGIASSVAAVVLCIVILAVAFWRSRKRRKRVPTEESSLSSSLSTSPS